MPDNLSRGILVFSCLLDQYIWPALGIRCCGRVVCPLILRINGRNMLYEQPLQPVLGTEVAEEILHFAVLLGSAKFLQDIAKQNEQVSCRGETSS